MELCDKMVDLEAARLAVRDLEEYHKALDQALMKYHTDKMTEINGNKRSQIIVFCFFAE